MAASVQVPVLHTAHILKEGIPQVVRRTFTLHNLVMFPTMVSLPLSNGTSCTSYLVMLCHRMIPLSWHETLGRID